VPLVELATACPGITGDDPAKPLWWQKGNRRRAKPVIAG
jgi:hypothetical protein